MITDDIGKIESLIDHTPIDDIVGIIYRTGQTVDLGHFVAVVPKNGFWYWIDSAWSEQKDRPGEEGLITKYTPDQIKKYIKNVDKNPVVQTSGGPIGGFYTAYFVTRKVLDDPGGDFASPLKLKNPKSKYLSPTSKIRRARKKRKDNINNFKKNIKK